MNSHYLCGLREFNFKLDGTPRLLAEANSNLLKNPTSLSPTAILKNILISAMLKSQILRNIIVTEHPLELVSRTGHQHLAHSPNKNQSINYSSGKTGRKTDFEDVHVLSPGTYKMLPYMAKVTFQI